MLNRVVLLACGAFVPLAAPSAVAAQQHDDSAPVAPAAHAEAPTDPETERVAAVLAAYRDALVGGDAAAMETLFRDDSMVFENGKAEGSFAQYLAHHLGPELDAIVAFTFSDPTIQVRVVGPVAFGYETYSYRIALDDGRVIERDGVATSVLILEEGKWKIAQYHSSSRAPRPN